MSQLCPSHTYTVGFLPFSPTRRAINCGKFPPPVFQNIFPFLTYNVFQIQNIQKIFKNSHFLLVQAIVNFCPDYCNNLLICLHAATIVPSPQAILNITARMML